MTLNLFRNHNFWNILYVNLKVQGQGCCKQGKLLEFINSLPIKGSI